MALGSLVPFPTNMPAQAPAAGAKKDDKKQPQAPQAGKTAAPAPKQPPAPAKPTDPDPVHAQQAAAKAAPPPVTNPISPPASNNPNPFNAPVTPAAGQTAQQAQQQAQQPGGGGLFSTIAGLGWPMQSKAPAGLDPVQQQKYLAGEYGNKYPPSAPKPLSLSDIFAAIGGAISGANKTVTGALNQVGDQFINTAANKAGAVAGQQVAGQLGGGQIPPALMQQIPPQYQQMAQQYAAGQLPLPTAAAASPAGQWGANAAAPTATANQPTQEDLEVLLALVNGEALQDTTTGQIILDFSSIPEAQRLQMAQQLIQEAGYDVSGLSVPSPASTGGLSGLAATGPTSTSLPVSLAGTAQSALPAAGSALSAANTVGAQELQQLQALGVSPADLAALFENMAANGTFAPSAAGTPSTAPSAATAQGIPDFLMQSPPSSPYPASPTTTSIADLFPQAASPSTGVNPRTGQTEAIYRGQPVTTPTPAVAAAQPGPQSLSDLLASFPPEVLNDPKILEMLNQILGALPAPIANAAPVLTARNPALGIASGTTKKQTTALPAYQQVFASQGQ